jgi:hypothetical protein
MPWPPCLGCSVPRGPAHPRDAHLRVPALCALPLLLPCHAADGAPPRNTCAFALGACRPASRQCLPLLPQQAGWRSPLIHSRSPARAHPFPQRVWTTRWRQRQCWRAPRRRSLSGPRPWTALPCAQGPSAAKRGGRQPSLAYERLRKATRLRCSQQSGRHGAEAAGSRGRAGRGPTPPSSTAAP